MRIFTGMDWEGCLSYWSKMTSIPKKEFKVRLNDGGTRGKTRYGMCRIGVRKGDCTLKLMHSLIDQVYNELMKR
jgi:hypothetical protein